MTAIGQYIKRRPPVAADCASIRKGKREWDPWPDGITGATLRIHNAGLGTGSAKVCAIYRGESNQP
jgi:hypothetical protein